MLLIRADHSDQTHRATESDSSEFLSRSVIFLCTLAFVLVNHVWLLTEMSTLFINASIFQPKHSAGGA